MKSFLIWLLLFSLEFHASIENFRFQDSNSTNVKVLPTPLPSDGLSNLPTFYPSKPSSNQLPSLSNTFVPSINTHSHKNKVSFQDTYEIVGTTFSILSIFASILLIMLTLRAKFIVLIQIMFCMTIFQLLFDIGCLILFNSTHNDRVQYAAVSLQLIGGISSTLYSNVLAFAVAFIIGYRNFVDARYYFNAITFTFIIPGIITFIIYSCGYFMHIEQLLEVAILDLNYYIRLISILFNIICGFYSWLVTRRILTQNRYLTLSNRFVISCISCASFQI